MIDLSEGAVARDLVALVSGMGISPLVWLLPGDLPRLDLGVGMPAEPLADVLAASASADLSAGGGSDPARDHAIVARVVGALGEGRGSRTSPAGLRALAQVGDPRDDIETVTLTAAQLERVTGLFGPGRGRPGGDRAGHGAGGAAAGPGPARLRAFPAAPQRAAGDRAGPGRDHVRQRDARDLRGRVPHAPAPPGAAG